MDEIENFDNENVVDEVLEKTKKYIPKIKTANKEKRKKLVNLPVFIIVTIFHIALLVLGILSVCDIKALWDETYQNRLGGIWFLVLFSSYLMFFFECAPFLIGKKIRKIMLTFSIIIYTGLQLIPILYLVNHQTIFHAIKKVGMWQVFDAFVFSLITLIGSYIATLMLYIVPLFSYDFDKMDEFKELDSGDSGIAKTILYFFLNILIGIYRLILLIPKLREKSLNTYFIVFLPLSIFLLPFAAETIAIILIMVVIIYIVSLIEGVFFNSVSYGSSSITVVDQYGNEITLYECGSSYKDDAGNYYSENADGTYSQD